MAFTYSPKIVTDGLVFAVDAANTKSYPGSGTTWKDLSGNGNDGTLTNGPTFDSGSGGSIVFDGSDDYATFGNIFNFTYDDSLTIFLVHKISDVSSYDPIISKMNSSPPYNGWEFSIGPSADRNELYFSIRTTLSDAITARSTNINLSVGQLHISTVTYDGSSSVNGVKFYSNGTPNNSISEVNNAGSTIPTSSANLQFAKRSTSGGSNPCSIYLTHIYNRALTPSEITQNYNALKGRFGIS